MMAYTALMNTQLPDGTWTIPPNEVARRRARHFRVLWFTDAAAAQPPTVADGLAPGDVINGEAAPLIEVAIAGGQGPAVSGLDVVLTKVTGVIWTVGGVDYPSADMPGATLNVAQSPGVVTVTARAEAGYTITSTPLTWSLTVAAPGVIFSDDFGSVALTESAFLARTTPVGGATVAKAGSGSVTVNASGHLVINATSGATAVEWALPGGATGQPGTMTVELESASGTTGTIELVMSKTAATGTQARAVFNPASGEYWAQVTISNSAGASAHTTGQTFAAGSLLRAGMTESGGIATVTAQHNSAAVQSHVGASAFTDNGVVRVFCSAGRTAVVRSVTWEEAV